MSPARAVRPRPRRWSPSCPRPARTSAGLWAENELRTHGVVHKRIVRPGIGELVLESSAFSVDGSDGLSMVVFLPTNVATARGIEQLVRALPG